ncbi:MAG: Octanoyltransferase [Caldanaerobacter subterraneus]|uniref:Octanoyltransferase n=4 Tax=Caldanaerobacter subterraneus TaxID=911092 RepID=LIPB_CALS4|nr:MULTISPECIES: lipoyl(octanoyl) transferase LipB [Caldanaerobacter]Q8R9E0.1 RecName: Full=Octanoyltransferase; AltName: Full=Lipoate-protein ligase B; AltName: Full=Lipoyl/octanoyl transferase; AltName: Full=Octanoyl-[acyl-carrier-protein]-protein N-octanoyltransferase [Caldanaerobacter subterraneus subsp. tengcongensis MB4]AAM24874.1 Lipoate-protein ligase B [Caldanaerobacter subterraneus subsp. tengcongensis MB4]ERM92779.1 octanoyltransferase [Caldanaerobacter subterraneus subsp. yonseiensis
MRRGEVLKLGVVPYLEGKEIQLKAFEKVKKEETDGILILLQHKPVYTIGVSGGYDEDILVPIDYIKEKAELYKVERGGKITFHGPGQVVAYPIFNLAKWQKDVHLFVHNLEEAVIRLLREYGIIAGRKEKYTGVWVGDEKICAIGIAVKRWITWHGIALNVNTDLSYFGLINACGITEFGVTSMKKLGIEVEIEEVMDRLVDKFEEVFEIKFEEIDLTRLAVVDSAKA